MKNVCNSMDNNQAQKPEYIEHQENINCQQFFGNMYNCVFTMPVDDNKPIASIEEELFHFIHPSVTDEDKFLHIILIFNYLHNPT